MNAYTVLRLVHGYWRWAVLLSAVVVLVRTTVGTLTRKQWSGDDERAARWFLLAVDVQMAIGVLLYFGFSPFWSATLHSFQETMQGQVSRFFGIEHETAMLLAVMAAHIGRVRSTRAAEGVGKHRTMLISVVVFSVFVLWAIPWPWREMGRPLFRIGFE
jgi:hypothetical protein